MNQQRISQYQTSNKPKRQLSLSVSQANSLTDKKQQQKIQNKQQRLPKPPSQLRERQKTIKQESTQNIQNRQSRFTKISQAQSKDSRNNSKSSIKEHRLKINRLNLQKKDEFIAYSIVNKQSNSGMFSHERLLLLNSLQRKLMYYSNIPKNLPFMSAQQYLQYPQKPKEEIQFQKVKKFTFLPTRLNIGQILVSFIQKSERKQWKLVMGSNKIMNDWVEMVNEVFKKEHYEQRKRQIKYPPKPTAPQQIQQTNNYETPFIKQLKQFITEDPDKLRQRKKTQVRKSIDSTKFLKGHEYIVDLAVNQVLQEEEKSEDIWLNLEVQKKEQKFSEEHRKRVQTASEQINNNNSQLQKEKSIQIRPKKQTSQTVQIIPKQSQKKKPVLDTFQNQKLNVLLKSNVQANKNQKPTIHQDLNIYIQKNTEKTPQKYGSLKQKQRIYETNLKQNSRFSTKTEQPNNLKVIDQADSNVNTGQQFSQNSFYLNNQQNMHSLHQSPTQKKSEPFYNNKQSPPSKVTTVVQQQINNSNFQYNNKNLEKNSLLFKEKKLSPQRIYQPKRNSLFSNEETFNQQGLQKSQRWLSLWLQSAPSLKKQIYANFIQKCQSIIPQIINNLRYHQHLCQKEVNNLENTQVNTHFNFQIQGISFKFVKKLLLPEGMNELRDIFQLAKSQELLQNILKYHKDLQYEYNNFFHIYKSLQEQFQQSMPIHLPLIAHFSYKSISILCKAHIGTCYNPMKLLNSSNDLNLYQPYLQYVEEKCHINFLQESFTIYQVSLDDRKILYMDSLTDFLPLIKKFKSFHQIPSEYIQNYIKKGFIDNRNDLIQIDNHISKAVVKIASQKLQKRRRTIVNQMDLLQILKESGLDKSYLSCIYSGVNNSWIKSILVSEIISQVYFKICHVYLIKLFISQRNLGSDYTRNSHRSQMPNSTNTSLRNNTNKTANVSFTKQYDLIIYECLQYLLYRNTKLWNHLTIVLKQNYGISFPNSLLNHVNWKYLISSFLTKLDISANVKYWSQSSGWQKVQLKKQQLQLTFILKTNNLPLSLFKPQFKNILSQIKLSLQNQQSTIQIYHNLLEILEIQRQTFNNTSYMLISDDYTILNPYEKSMIKYLISHYFVLNISNAHYQRQSYLKNKILQVYQYLISHQNHSICGNNDYQTSLLGIKWLIKSKQYQLAKILLQEQMEAQSIWTSNYSLIIKYYDVSSLFFLKMHSHTNSIIYSLKSFQLAIDYQQEEGQANLAQKAFQAANIHFQCSQFVKSLQFYQTTTNIIEKLSKGSLSYLTIQFLNMYAKKALIQLAMGNIVQSLNQCVNCLAKCQQYYNEELTDTEEIDLLENCQITCFQIMFRCYEITKKWNQMIRLASLCCIKFMEDRILKIRIQKIQRPSNELIIKLLKISWLSLLHFVFDSNSSKQSTKINSNILKKTVQRLIATYPIKRYHSDQIVTFIQEQILENRDRQNSLSVQYKRAYHNQEGGFAAQNSVLMSLLNEMILIIIKNDSEWRTGQIRQKNNRISLSYPDKNQYKNQNYQQQSPPIFPYNLYNLKNNIDSKMMILQGLIILTQKQFVLGSLTQYQEKSEGQNWE